MKTSKLSKIFGVGLTLVLLLSMVALTVSAAPPSQMTWIKQSHPSASASVFDNPSEITDFAVAPDGVVYLTDNVNNLVKRGSSGTVWSSVANWPGTQPLYVAVAPDDSNCIFVYDGAGAFRISNDAGITWATLPALPAANAGAVVTDIAIGPARSGLLLDREYAVALADPATGATATALQQGDLLMVGATAAWATVAASTGVADFMRVELSPNYAGDRVVTAIGVTAAGAKRVFFINAATNANLTNSPVTVATYGLDYTNIASATSLLRADIALASDFDPTDSNAYRAWVSFGSQTGNASDDVYRVDGPAARDLNSVTAAQAIDSISYSGTNDAGTLFVSYLSTVTVVKRTASPQSNSPTWVTTKNQPTGNGSGQIRVQPDFGSTNQVFVGTTGTNESAWSVSDDGGVSFYQRSYIDNGAANGYVSIDDVAITSDGSAMYLVTDDGTDMHVWYQVVPPSSMSAKRMFTVIGGGASVNQIALNPDWTSSPTIFVADNAAPSNLYVSSDGGATWKTRVGPGAATTDYIYAVDASTLYATIGANFYKSTNAGWTWEDAVGITTSAITVQNIAAADDGSLFASSTGSTYRSTNGGASWSTFGTYNNPGGADYVLPDANYSENGIVYLASQAAGSVWRMESGDNTWRDMNVTTPTNCFGLEQYNGVLYAMSTTGCWRSLNPTAELAGIAWQFMNVTDTAFAATMSWFNVDPASGVLYAANNLDDQWAYDDYLSTAVPNITMPAEGYVLGVDPVNGRADVLTLIWDTMGTSTGIATDFRVQITDAAVGWNAPTVNALSTPGNPAAPSTTVAVTGGAIAVNLRANTNYLLRIRVEDTSSADAVFSGWSDVVAFTVAAGGVVQAGQAGVELLGPGGDTTTTLTPGFSWAPLSGVTEYQFILATDAALTQTVAGTPVTLTTTAFSLSEPLDYGTTYFWAVKPTKPTSGIQTIGTFTTMSEPTEAGDSPVVTPIITIDGGTSDTPGIPTAAVWAVIIIGAVLVVAVLVLIVRTRRPL